MALWRSRLKIHQFLISRAVNHAQTGRLLRFSRSSHTCSRRIKPLISDAILII
jgi:hypothetical protein